MSVIITAINRVIPSFVDPARAEIRFRLLREGEQSTGKRTLYFYRSWGSLSRLVMVFEDEGSGSGLATQTFRVPIAELLAQGEWVAVGVDDNPPRKSRAIYLTLTESALLPFNITQGEGGSVGGDPATLAARVRVSGVDAAREVVAIERPADGLWRVAGQGVTVAGILSMELQVTGGQVFAVALDDFGVQYQPNLDVTVGQTIRPTVYAGWLYRITEAGTLPATEPEWWPIDGDNAPRELGTARAVAVRYYRPLAHGPVPVEMI